MQKISVSISGHQTSITLEPEFIEILKKIATIQHTSVSAIIYKIDNSRSQNTNLSSAVRIWILNQMILPDK
jgi:predicted DNA-binding ribbon-helix-helix protein